MFLGVFHSVILFRKGDAMLHIADRKREREITGAQAEALQEYLACMYLSEHFQAAFEPFFEELVDKTQQRLEGQFDSLLEHMLLE